MEDTGDNEKELKEIYKLSEEEHSKIYKTRSIRNTKKRKEKTKAQIRKRTELYFKCQTSFDGKEPEHKLV